MLLRLLGMKAAQKYPDLPREEAIERMMIAEMSQAIYNDDRAREAAGKIVR